VHCHGGIRSLIGEKIWLPTFDLSYKLALLCQNIIVYINVCAESLLDVDQFIL
jgi:hypothetical protein